LLAPARAANILSVLRTLRQFARAAGLVAAAVIACASPAGWSAELPSAAPDGAGDFLVGLWTPEQGLPNSSVTTIAQTPDGYLWVGTYNGLARFDGVRFLTFDPLNTPALRHARIRKLFLDDAGTLWINSYDGSLTTHRGDGFRLEWRGSGSPDASASLVSSRSNAVVFLLNTGELIRRSRDGVTNAWQTLRPPAASSGTLALEDGAGTIWYRGRDRQMYRLKGDTFAAAPTNAALAGSRLNWLAIGPEGALWVGGERGLWAWDGAGFVDRTPTNAPASRDISFFTFARDGSLWCIADGCVRRAVGRRWVSEVEAWRGVLAGLSSRLGAVEDAEGGMWFYHYGRGLFHVTRAGVARRPSVADGLPGDRVDDFFCDREGNLWAGIDRGGLARLRERRFRVVRVGDGATTRAIVSLCEDAEGSIWLGTFGGGLHRLAGGRLEAIPFPAGVGEFVFSLCPDRGGRLWLSAGEEDLYLWENGIIRPASPTHHAVKVVLTDRQGQLWLGTKSSLFKSAGGVFKRMLNEPALYPTEVRALAEDAAGGIWVGTGGGELVRLKGERAAVFKPTDALARSPVWSLRCAPDGTIWAGTFRGGLLRLKEGRFTRLTQSEGLPSDVVSQVLDDGEGFLWLGTPQGIARLAMSDVDAYAEGRTKSLALSIHGLYDGLPTLECSGGYQPAAWRTRDGRLWFATTKGAVSIQPAVPTANPPPPPVVIEEVLVDGKSVPLSSLPVFTTGRSLRKSPPVLTVKPGQRQVEFRYTGLSLSAPDKVRFRHQLEGLDTDWVEAGSQRVAQYPYLRPGNYVFRVAAANSGGAWNPHAAAISVRRLPHFYEAWWFPTLLAAAVIGLVGLGVRRAATTRLRRELQLLERQRAVERDRARIAKDIHDDLGAGLTQIALLSELARRDTPEEAPAHLEQISGTARELTRAMDEIVWAINPRNDTLDSLLTYVCKFAQDYLGVARIRCRLDLPEQVPALPLTTEVRHNLFLAVKEALNNIVKHAQASEVWLRVTLSADRLAVVLEDNGRGLAAAAGSHSEPGRLSHGHGLENLAHRLKAIGGECRVLSEPGRGTRVALSFRHDALRSPVMATAREAVSPAS
jgi:signal transduction histidine kinase/ligand-binding sensor domain-containing protein